MIANPVIARAVRLLSDSGYSELSGRLRIGTLEIEVAGALVGSPRGMDLVVILDSIEDTERRLRQKVDALSRALDVYGSRRSLTAVVVGPPPSPVTVTSMARVARVLVVGLDGQHLESSLAVLLPLPLPSPTDADVDPLIKLREHVAELSGGPWLDGLLAASLRGADEVAQHVRRLLLESMGRSP